MNKNQRLCLSVFFLHGSLFCTKSGSFVSTWVKYYCIYQREPKRMTMMLFDQKSGGKNVSGSFFSFFVTYNSSRALSLNSMCNLWIGEWMLAQATSLFPMLTRLWSWHEKMRIASLSWHQCRHLALCPSHSTLPHTQGQ